MRKDLFPAQSSGSGTLSAPQLTMAEKIGSHASASILRNPIRGRGPWKRTTSKQRADRPHTPPANDSHAAAPDVRPYDIRPNRNAAAVNAGSNRRLRSSPADRTKIFFAGDLSDDPRSPLPAEESGRLAVSHAAALANDALVPGELYDLFRWHDSDAGISRRASDGRPPGRPGCNSKSEHRPVESDAHSPSASNSATRRDRPELVRSNTLEHPGVGPRELVSRKVKSRIEGANFNPRRFISHRYRHQPVAKI